MNFSSPIMLWKMFFFLEFGRLMFQKSFFIMVQTSTDLWVSCSILRLRCLNSFLCLIQKPFFARRTTLLIRLIESRKMLITPFQNIFVLFHFQSEFNYNVKVDEKHTFEVVFFGFHSIDSCPWNRVNFFILSPVSNFSKQQQSIV